MRSCRTLEYSGLFGLLTGGRYMLVILYYLLIMIVIMSLPDSVSSMVISFLRHRDFLIYVVALTLLSVSFIFLIEICLNS